MTLTVDHERFPEFLDRLTGPEGINLRDEGATHDCATPTDTSATVSIMVAMGFGHDEIRSTLAYFAARGGFNDREILLEVGLTAGDEEALKHRHVPEEN